MRVSSANIGIILQVCVMSAMKQGNVDDHDDAHLLQHLEEHLVVHLILAMCTLLKARIQVLWSWPMLGK